jgi:pyruvate-formate lyase-activating enzyme
MLNEIGFYTLTDERARRVATQPDPPLSRCEILLGGSCNFRCPYCRHVGGPDASLENVLNTLRLWIVDGLQAVRFSGGEPTQWKGLRDVVAFAAKHIPRVAVSTNGSAPWSIYKELIDAGVNDFSVSLDACCAADGERMAGGVKGAFEVVVENIRHMCSLVYVTVGVVLTEVNQARLSDIVVFAHDLGVADVRVIPAVQYGSVLRVGSLPVEGHPILTWRWSRLREGRPVRGIHAGDSQKCSLVLDDMAVMGRRHYPCIIYLREGGRAIGLVGPHMREERRAWYEKHRSGCDLICSRSCLDFCVAHNNQVTDQAELAFRGSEEILAGGF